MGPHRPSDGGRIELSEVNILVLRAAGTNCDVETAYAFEKAGAKATLAHVNRLVDRSVSLDDFQVLAIPGGFTYGDDVSAGRILAGELKNRLADAIAAFVEADRLVIGICNGFQVLVKMGLLPGDESSGRVTLTNNDSNRYEDRWVHLKVDGSRTPFLASDDVIYLPVAHGEGKFVVDNDATLESLESNGRIVLRYCDDNGLDAPFPYNPNGSVGSVAGICSASGRVFGLMPHPERNIETLAPSALDSRGVPRSR